MVHGRKERTECNAREFALGITTQTARQPGSTHRICIALDAIDACFVDGMVPAEVGCWCRWQDGMGGVGWVFVWLDASAQLSGLLQVR